METLASPPSCAIVERLEERTFLSTASPAAAAVVVTPERHSLMSLLAYNRPGAGFKYRTYAAVQEDEFDEPVNSAFTHTLRIGSKPKTYDNKSSNIVSYGNIAGGSLSAGWHGNSTGTFSVDFSKGTGAITTSLSLAGKQDPSSSLVNFGTINGTGDLAGVTYIGTLKDSATGTGAFAGALFGPYAAEFGYAWYFNGSDYVANGFAGGKQNPATPSSP